MEVFREVDQQLANIEALETNRETLMERETANPAGEVPQGVFVLLGHLLLFALQNLLHQLVAIALYLLQELPVPRF